ncbi:patatin-like phospholipase family protein [Mumia sp. DW29H23]|uniref:patatin-like phospholipase family protein n=1 Tax=Mumia sp. DW29H23 TaxID=3421241 RepID=UPI003D68C82A
MSTRALVLGGGGITGIAWEIGLLHGLVEAGVDLTDADLVVGTSAGSVVGAQVTNGATTEAMYARQLAPLGTYGPEPTAVIGAAVTARWIWTGLRSGRDLEALGRRLGAYAVRAAASGRLPSEEERIAVVSRRLVSQEWPARDLRVTAVDAQTGAFRVFGADDGVPLARAVAASCAVPGVYPPVTIDGRRYIDGGTRSSANADLAAGHDRVVALTPIAAAVPRSRGAAAQLAGIGSAHTVVAPDKPAREAIGRNVLDPAARARTARAGYAQARAVAGAVSEIWA